MALTNEIEYNNEKYIILIKLMRTAISPSIDKIPDDQTINLPMDNVNKLEIVTDITNPLLTATIDFTDGQESYLNGFTGSACNYAYIGIKKYDQATQGDNTGIATFDWTFEHLFLIDDISITGKSNDNINYKMKLTSSYFWNFLTSTPISTNSGAEQSISSIISKLFNASGLPTGSKLPQFSSDLINSRHFITKTGHPMIDSYRYLLTQLNRGNDLLTNGLSLMAYDHMDNKYDIWTSNSTKDGLDSETIYSDAIRINVNQNTLDTLTQQNPPKVLMSNYKTNRDIIKLLRDNKRITYDYDTNTFSGVDTLTTSLINAVMSSNDVNFQSKFKEIEQYISKNIEHQYQNFETTSSNWNDEVNQFDGLMSTLTSNNVLSINTSGRFDRLVGDSLYLDVDLNIDALSSLQYLLGWWKCLRVRHTFTPSSYTSNIMIGRFTEMRNVDKIRDSI